jgi:hypothetical protein
MSPSRRKNASIDPWRSMVKDLQLGDGIFPSIFTAAETCIAPYSYRGGVEATNCAERRHDIPVPVCTQSF